MCNTFFYFLLNCFKKKKHIEKHMHSVVWESVLVKYYVQLCVFNLIALI